MGSGGHNFDNLTGQKFFRLKVIEQVESKYYHYDDKVAVQTRYLCECDCGNFKVIKRGDLKNGHTKSCGCFRKETSSLKAKNTLLKYKNINGHIVKNKYDITDKSYLKDLASILFKCSFIPDFVVPFRIRANGIIDVGQYWGDKNAYLVNHKQFLQKIKQEKREINLAFVGHKEFSKSQIVKLEK